MADVVTETRDGIRFIRLNRPDQLNSTTTAMYRDIGLGVLDAISDPDVDVIVVTGTGRAFSTGGDLKEFLALLDEPATLFANYSKAYQIDAPFEILVTSPKPTICMANGIACAGGLALLLSCDVTIAAESARFGTPEGRIGLHDHYLPALLEWKVGLSRTLYLNLTAELISAERAERWGLVHLVVPDAELLDRTMALARSIQSTAPEAQYGYKSRLLAKPPLLNDARPTVQSATSAAAKEGIRAFLEKRPPSWVRNTG